MFKFTTSLIKIILIMKLQKHLINFVSDIFVGIFSSQMFFYINLKGKLRKIMIKFIFLRFFCCNIRNCSSEQNI